MALVYRGIIIRYDVTAADVIAESVFFLELIRTEIITSCTAWRSRSPWWGTKGRRFPTSRSTSRVTRSKPFRIGLTETFWKILIRFEFCSKIIVVLWIDFWINVGMLFWKPSKNVFLHQNNFLNRYQHQKNAWKITINQGFCYIDATSNSRKGNLNFPKIK